MRNLLFAVLAMASFLIASDPPRMAPIVNSSVLVTGQVFNVHEDGNFSLAEVVDGELQVTYSTFEPQDLVTRWKDQVGNEHEVHTPVRAGVTESGLRKAIERHARMVNMMQEAFPPQLP